MAKQVTIAFNNPANELNLDHIEVWKKIGVSGTLTKFGADVPVVSGGAPYNIVDQSADIVGGADVHYEVRTYSPTGEFSLATANILISPDVTSSGGSVREGESFTLGDFGDLTGVTSVTIDLVPCTSVVVAGDNLSLTAVAPNDGVRYGESVAIKVA